MIGKYGAVVLIGYGGPEKPEDIIPFLNKVAQGRPIPEDRLKEVAHHYELIGGKSPLNEYTYKQGSKLKTFLDERGFEVPYFVAMRNWHPFINDTVREVADSGVKDVIGIIMAAHQTDTSWEKYQREIDQACREENVDLNIVYTKPLYDHPLFIEDCADRIQECFDKIPSEEIDKTALIFTAHSIPLEMAASSQYVSQYETSCRLVAKKLGFDYWLVAYQSRSGNPREPWLEPDVCDLIASLSKDKIKNVVIQAIGFLCDHAEVLYDIGIEAKEACDEAGLNLYIAKTVNDDDKFVRAMEEEVLKFLNG